MTDLSYVIQESITRNGQYEPFDLQVSRGQITGHTVVSLYGYQTAVGVTSIPMWENATTYSYPSSAVVMTLVSSNAGDTAVSVQINGLDSGYNPISEVVALNGTTGVASTLSYLRINSMQVTAGNPAGDITASNGGTTYAKILQGINRTQTSIYTVPAGYTFYLQRVQGFTNSTYTSGQYATYRVYQKTFGGIASYFAQRPFISNFNIIRIYPNTYPAKTDIQWQVAASATTLACGLAIEGVLIKNDGNI
jgi:hypothetical protein